MSATAAFQDPDFEVIARDGVPVEKTIHLLAMMLFRHLAQNRLRELGPDFYVGANQFVYYSHEQAREVFEEERQQDLFDQGLRPAKPLKTAFRGPDTFIVRGVSHRERDTWKAWEENDRLPDLVLELLSPSTAKADYGEKMRIYQDIFKCSEYFLYEPRGELVDGYRLLDHAYQKISRSAEGRLWSGELQVEIGVWYGEYEGTEGPWLRLFYPDGRLVLTTEELAEQHAEQERQAKEAAEQAKEVAEQHTEQQRREKEQERQAKEAAEQAKEAAEQHTEQQRQAKEAALERANAAEIENARLRARLAKLEGQDDGQS